MSERKEKANRFISHLREKFKSSSEKSWWPTYVYHFSDINNIINILKEGKLYSRNLAVKRGLMKNDNANNDIICHTPPEICDYVRFYFRPKTPTLFRNEGIIPEEKIVDGAHCPIPIYLFFKSKEIIGDDNSQFSEKTLASYFTKRDTEIDKLYQYNFDKIYHNESFDRDFESDIIQYRQAEVIIKDCVTLSEKLKYIVCRSEAEKDTLIYLLKKENIYQQHKDYIVYKPRTQVFNHKRLYVDSVSLSKSMIKVTFNPSTAYRDKINYVLIIKNLINNRIYQFKASEEYHSLNIINIKIPNGINQYEFSIYINKILVYQNSFEDETGIF